MRHSLEVSETAESGAAKLGVQDSRVTKALPLAYLALCLLYGSVGYYSLGYDDEFTNIVMVERLGFGVVQFFQGTDVHPPGSYFINALLYSVLGKWELVRLAGSLATAASLVYAVESVRRKYGNRNAAVLLVLLGLNPAILMWCTGVRWYAYFVPLLIWLSITPARRGWWYWAKCFGGLFALAYLGYAAFIVAIPILMLYWQDSRETSKEKAISMVKCGLPVAILYSYQLFIFLTVHIKSKDPQMSSLVQNLVGFAVSQLGNQGVFPVSVAAALSATGLIGIVLLALRADLAGNLKNRFFIIYSIGAALTILTGLAGKFRNLVIVSPWQALWISTVRVRASQQRAYWLCLAALAAGNVWGDFNVATHQDTTKNSWNLPVGQLLADLAAKKDKCDGDLVVISHDVALAWHLDKGGYQQISPYPHRAMPQEALASKHRCAILIKTYIGSLPPDAYQRMIGEVSAMRYSKAEQHRYGRDRYHAIKKRQDPRYPEYAFETTTYSKVENLSALSSWQPTSP